MMTAVIWNDDVDGWMARGHFVGTVDEIALTIGRHGVARFGEHCQVGRSPEIKVQGQSVRGSTVELETKNQG